MSISVAGLSILGFTGSRHGMTTMQCIRVGGFIMNHQPSVLHHGMCIGADEELHDIIRTVYPECHIVGHPPVNESKMSYVLCDGLWTPKEYLARDRDIVDCCDMLLATPGTKSPYRGSGTWYTIGCARRAHKAVVIILPDGSVKRRTHKIYQLGGTQTQTWRFVADAEYTFRQSQTMMAKHLLLPALGATRSIPYH